MVTKTPDLTQGAHFAEKFVDMIAAMSTGYDEIRVAFDQYLPGSLKERTRAKRTSKTTAVHYHVNDDTKIENLKMFLSHINTKSELTKYLSQKLIEYYSGSSQRLLVMYQGIVEARRPLEEVVSMPEMLEGRYSLEEADQLVLLNAFDVMQKDPDCKLDVFSVDTDVFVLLVGHYAHIPKSVTVIRTKKEKICIGKSYNKVGPKRADALIGWYAFKGV